MHNARLQTMFMLLYATLLLTPYSLVSAAEKKRGAYQGAMATEYPAWFKDSFLNLRERSTDRRILNTKSESMSLVSIVPAQSQPTFMVFDLNLH